MRTTLSCFASLPSAAVPSRPASVVALAPGTVQLWHLCDLLHLCARAAHTPILSPAEQARATRMRAGQARQEFLAGRTLLRLLLAGHLRCAPADVPLTLDRNGKPCLPHTPQLAFNLAHSGGLVVVALAGAGPLGVDLEAINPAFTAAEALELARTSFSPREFAQLQDVPAAQQANRFYTMWTMKEAPAKADGRGLRLPLSEIPTSCEAGSEHAETALTLGPQTFYLHRLHHLPGFAAALAVPLPRQTVILFDADTLVQAVTAHHVTSGCPKENSSGIVQTAARL